MRQLLLSMFSTLVLLTSCKKNNPKDDQVNETPQKVKFDISLSDHSIVEHYLPKVKSSGNSGSADFKPSVKLSDYFHRLEYFIYNSKGVKVAQMDIQADSSTGKFQVPEALLKPDKYSVVFLGRKEKNTGHSSAIYFGDDQRSPYLAHSLQREVTDLFYTFHEFEVKNNNTSIAVSLKRPGGKFKIIIEDDWPNSVNRIGMSINGYTVFYPKRDELDQRRNLDQAILKNYATSYEFVNGIRVPKQVYIDCSYENFVFTNSSNVTMLDATIIAYDKSDKIILKKTLNDIKVERNMITIVNLELFHNLNR